eukprot:TRINITY_DN11311_c0_g1_i1.p1 TRINITY_DN11311_c0_g1~~TRINITY_DN11311_c0_g1_i1.p1  ORF type:complete len:432 (+),score=88.85 TRINITY_DN11311_c0_g1_i1:8-1303(+)
MEVRSAEEQKAPTFFTLDNNTATSINPPAPTLNYMNMNVNNIQGFGVTATDEFPMLLEQAGVSSLAIQDGLLDAPTTNTNTNTANAPSIKPELPIPHTEQTFIPMQPYNISHINNTFQNHAVPVNGYMNNIVPTETVQQTRKRKLPEPTETNTKKRKGNKGLRHLSQRVCEKVEAKGRTSYNEVADELVEEIRSTTPDDKEKTPQQKSKFQNNIRRRVYDALNVLSALEIIKKEKKSIEWRGLPTTNPEGDLKILIDEKHAREHQIMRKKEYSDELQSQLTMYKELIQRNMNSSDTDIYERIFGPFIIVQASNDNSIQCEMSEDFTTYFFNFSDRFYVHDDKDILEQMVLSGNLPINPGSTINFPAEPLPHNIPLSTQKSTGQVNASTQEQHEAFSDSNFNNFQEMTFPSMFDPNSTMTYSQGFKFPSGGA